MMPIYDAGFKDGAILGYESAKKDILPVLNIIWKYLDLNLCDDCMLKELRGAMSQLPHTLKKEQ